MLGRLGPQELLIILVIAVIIFGPRQLPKLGRSLGETLREFRNVGKQIQDGIAGEDEEAKKA